MFFPPSEVRVAKAFVNGDFDIAGDPEQATALSPQLLNRFRSPSRLLRTLVMLSRLPQAENIRKVSPAKSFQPSTRSQRRHARKRDMEAVRFHYDVGDKFYALWLDKRRVYSCAYFPTGKEDIDDGQLAKLDYLCRKLRLKPGERLLDIGCGWGALMIHAARNYGVKVVGITLSSAQAQYALEQIQRERLGHQCHVELKDYRDLPKDVQFDKVVSVGMFEHVGPVQMQTYFRTAYRLTRPGGLFLNHGIVSMDRARSQPLRIRLRNKLWRTGNFIQEYVFPDAELVSLRHAIGWAEAVGFETRDAESLREHYVRTLRLWGRRLECSRAAAIKAADEATYRIWRLYMAASAHGFATGHLNIVQTLFAKPDAHGNTSLPWSRADLYDYDYKDVTLKAS